MRYRLFLCLLTSAAALHAEPITVQLTPPELSPETVLKEVFCIRPMREGRFNISTETQGSKLLVHCYGHGGSGWTTLFGSVGKAVRLFEEQGVSKETPIRVVGSGCMGLTCAIELKRRGYNVVGISTRRNYDITSWGAAGYFAMVSVMTSEEEQENLSQIGVESFNVFRSIEKGVHPYISSEAVRYLPVYCSKDTESGVEDLEKRGLIPPHQDVVLDFGKGVLHEDYVQYMTYFMDTSNIMMQLHAEVKRLQIPIEFKFVKAFGELEEEVVFNCSGLGARELNSDPCMIPVRGHLILLNEKAGTAHMDYMIYTKVEQEGREEYIYMFPKALAVSSEQPEGVPCRSSLGGTFIPNADRLSRDELKELDKKEFYKLLDRNSRFFHGVPWTLD